MIKMRGPDRDPTGNRWIRNPLLYAVELQDL